MVFLHFLYFDTFLFCTFVLLYFCIFVLCPSCLLIGQLTLYSIWWWCIYGDAITGLARGAPPFFGHHWIRNFVLLQKYVKNFAVAQKLWILWPFFQKFIAGRVCKILTQFFILVPPPFTGCLRRWNLTRFSKKFLIFSSIGALENGDVSMSDGPWHLAF